MDRRFGGMHYRVGGYNLYGGMQTPTDRPDPQNRLDRDDTSISRMFGTIGTLQRGKDCAYMAFYHFLINRGLCNEIPEDLKQEFTELGQSDVCKKTAPFPAVLLHKYLPGWSDGIKLEGKDDVHRFRLVTVGPKGSRRYLKSSMTDWAETARLEPYNFESLEELKDAAKGQPGLVYVVLKKGGAHLMALINDDKGVLRLIDSNKVQYQKVDHMMKDIIKLQLYQLVGEQIDSADARKQKVELKKIMQNEKQVEQAMRDWEAANAQDASDVLYLIGIMKKDIESAEFFPFVKTIAERIDRVNKDQNMQNIYNGFLTVHKLLKSEGVDKQKMLQLKKDYLVQIEQMFKEEGDKIPIGRINKVVRELEREFDREAKRAKLSTGEEEGGPSAP